MASEGVDLTPLIAALAELFPAVKPVPQPVPQPVAQRVCRECGAPEIRAKHLCASCYFRWAAAGRPDVVPPRQRRPRRTIARRFEDFRRVRGLGASVQQAAKYAGIPQYAGWRFEAQLRHAALSPSAGPSRCTRTAGHAPTQTPRSRAAGNSSQLSAPRQPATPSARPSARGSTHRERAA